MDKFSTYFSEKAAMAFQVGITRERTKYYFANPRMKTWLEAYRNSYLHSIDP